MTTPTPLKVNFHFHPHKNQHAILNSPARFRVVVAGRRFGKSRVAGGIVTPSLFAGQNIWWIAPTFDISKRIGWRMMEHICRPLINAGLIRANKTDLTMELPNGGRFQAKSADHPERLVGEGLDLAIIDEAGSVQEEAWTESLRPALSDRQGKAVFLGTPKGHNWFYGIYGRGLDPLQPDWQSFHYTTGDNPFIVPAEIEAARLELPERIFDQEYMAAFRDDAGSVFRNVGNVSTLSPREPYPGVFVFGVDFARDNDYTVISVIDLNTRQQVAIERFNEIGWIQQRGRIRTLYDRWHPRIIYAEANSVGSVNIEEMQATGLPVEAFMTTAQSKAPLIDSLALAIERGDIGLLNDPVQKGELTSYGFSRLPGGGFKYSAPSGGHDDTVMALAIAWHGTHQPTLELPSFLEW